MPVFDKSNYEIIDLTLLQGHAEDYVKVHSYAQEPFNAIIWSHDFVNNRWIEYNAVALKSFGDTDTVDSRFGIKLDSIKYIAIEFLNDKKYSINAYKNRGDVYIDVKEESAGPF